MRTLMFGSESYNLAAIIAIGVIVGYVYGPLVGVAVASGVMALCAAYAIMNVGGRGKKPLKGAPRKRISLNEDFNRPPLGGLLEAYME